LPALCKNKKGDIIRDTSSYEMVQRFSFLKSKDAPFLFLTLTDNVDLPLNGAVTYVGAPSP
jgi:hypothetical protein